MKAMEETVALLSKAREKDIHETFENFHTLGEEKEYRFCPVSGGTGNGMDIIRMRK